MSTISDCQRKFDERVVKTKLFVTVLCLSTILRLLLLASTDVLLNTGDDGSSYASLARMIMAADLSRDDGSRSPGYPLLLALLGNQPEAIRLTQILLGLCTTGALFVLSWQITSSTVASFVVSAYYGLSVTQARYEASLLSETLTTFTLTVCFLALSKVAVRVQFRSATPGPLPT